MGHFSEYFPQPNGNGGTEIKPWFEVVYVVYLRWDQKCVKTQTTQKRITGQNADAATLLRFEFISQQIIENYYA